MKLQATKGCIYIYICTSKKLKRVLSLSKLTKKKTKNGKLRFFSTKAKLLSSKNVQEQQEVFLKD